MSLTQELKRKEFETLWARYPNKDGKKQAWKHYNRDIKTYADVLKINTALDNYIAHLKQEDWKKPKNGSTWFNNWQDWIKEFTANELIKPIISPSIKLPEPKRLRHSDGTLFSFRQVLVATSGEGSKPVQCYDRYSRKKGSFAIQTITRLNNAPCNMW